MPNKASLLNQLKTLVQEIDDCGCPPRPGPCCPPPKPKGCGPCCEFPFAQVCFTCPPEGPLPTYPCPVKPLQMPCLPGRGPTPEQMAAKERQNPSSRYDNFYNNYNIDYRQEALVEPKGSPHPDPCNCGSTGKKPCEDYTKINKGPTSHYNHGCPTGFKPCQMKLCPPPCCNPIGVWRAKVLPCPPGAKQAKPVSNLLPPPECCNRPGCHHWKPEGGPCCYDAPCRAHCFNHPPGMKPSGKAACTLPPQMCPS